VIVEDAAETLISVDYVCSSFLSTWFQTKSRAVGADLWECKAGRETGVGPGLYCQGSWLPASSTAPAGERAHRTLKKCSGPCETLHGMGSFPCKRGLAAMQTIWTAGQQTCVRISPTGHDIL
jgi:hypothetical protein